MASRPAAGHEQDAWKVSRLLRMVREFTEIF